MTKLSKQRSELEKQLSVIREAELQESKKNIAVLLKTLKPEIDAYKSLIRFEKYGKVQVELTYHIELTFDAYDLCHNPKSRLDSSYDLGDFEGYCEVGPVKEPKGYRITNFVDEDNFCNRGIEEYSQLVVIHPELKKHCDAFLKAKRTLAKKVVKTAEKLGVDQDMAFDAIGDILYK